MSSLFSAKNKNKQKQAPESFRGKAVSECASLGSQAQPLAASFHNRRREERWEEACVGRIQLPQHRALALGTLTTLSSRRPRNTRARPECCRYLLDNSLPPKESKLKHNTSIKSLFLSIYKQCLKYQMWEELPKT